MRQALYTLEKNVDAVKDNKGYKMENAGTENSACNLLIFILGLTWLGIAVLEFRDNWSYRRDPPDDQELVDILRRVYDKYPISPNYQCCDD
jgi:hypothetical protein